MLASRRRTPSVAEVTGASEDSPRFPTVKPRKILKSECLLFRRVGKGGREEADTYASSSRWNFPWPETESAELAKKRLEFTDKTL